MITTEFLDAMASVADSNKEQHVYHHYDKDVKPTFNVKIEKNSKGYNWEITVIGVSSNKEAFELELQALNAIRVLIETDQDLTA